MTKQVIHTESAPAAVGPYSQGIRSGPFVFASAQLPIDSSGRFISDDLPAATRACLENLKSILGQGGASVEDIVKITLYLTAIDDFEQVNKAYADFFSASSAPPARSCVEVAALPKKARIAMDAIAYAIGLRSLPLEPSGQTAATFQ